MDGSEADDASDDMEDVEIPSDINLDDIPKDTSELLKEGIDYATNFALALVPSPANLAGMYVSMFPATDDSTSIEEDIQRSAHASGALDWFTKQRLTKRRVSFTANVCGSKGCTRLHFGTSNFCVEHDAQESALHEEEIVRFQQVDASNSASEAAAGAPPAPPAKSGSVFDGNTKLNDVGSQARVSLKIDMRREVAIYTEQLDKKDDITEAHMKLGKDVLTDSKLGGKKVAFWEKPQMVHQFTQLDHDGDGVITWKDICAHVRRFNPMFLADKDDAALEHELGEWIKQASYNGNPEMNLVSYAKSLVKLRADSKLTGYNDICRTAFWDLRSVVLCYPTVQPKGELLKRGYMIAVETANSWKRRYFEPVSSDEASAATSARDAKILRNSSDSKKAPVVLAPIESRFTLGYYMNDPSMPFSSTGKGVDVTQKGTIDLLQVTVVDLSPKTAITDTMFGSLAGAGYSHDVLQGMIVFKVTVSGGRRYTLAASGENALKWISYFTWFSNAKRSAEKWIDDWGTRKSAKITIRDWALAGTVVAKISLGAVFLEETKAAIVKAKKAEKWRQVKKLQDKMSTTWAKCYEVTARDKFLVSTVGLDMSSLQDAQNKVISTIKSLVMHKAYFQQFDRSFCFGGFSATHTSLVALMNAYAYGSVFKNKVMENMYSVKWDSKTEARDCACCGIVFKSLTLRKTLGKCHCRSCGRIVCHTCASKEIYLEVTKTFERVCEACILVGHPPADRLLLIGCGEEEQEGGKEEEQKTSKKTKGTDSGPSRRLFRSYEGNKLSMSSVCSTADVSSLERVAIANVVIAKEQSAGDAADTSGVRLDVSGEGGCGCVIG
jgi:hypothetical protein